MREAKFQGCLCQRLNLPPDQERQATRPLHRLVKKLVPRAASYDKSPVSKDVRQQGLELLGIRPGRYFDFLQRQFDKRGLRSSLTGEGDRLPHTTPI